MYSKCNYVHFLSFHHVMWVCLACHAMSRGVLPYTERKQAIVQNYEKVRQSKYHISSSSALGDTRVVQGSKVCVRSSPIYGAGGKAVYMRGAQLQCGILQTDVVNPALTEKCSFKVIRGDTASARKDGDTTPVGEGGGASSSMEVEGDTSSKQVEVITMADKEGSVDEISVTQGEHSDGNTIRLGLLFLSLSLMKYRMLLSVNM